MAKENRKPVNWKWVRNICAALTATTIAVFVTVFCPLDQQLFNLVLFHPSRYPDGWYNLKEIAGCKIEDTYFTASDGNRVHAWYIEKPGAKLTTLVSHGNGFNLTFLLENFKMLLNDGSSVFAYDYEGYGRSEGQPSVERACDDARKAYSYLVTRKHVRPDSIILFGESLGTGITGNLASKVASAGVILQCPFLSLRERAVEILPVEHIYPQFLFPENALDNAAVFSKQHPPLLIVGGVKDTVLPVHHADKLAEVALAPKSYIRIEEAGHSGDPLLLQSPLYAQSLKAFLAATIKP
ncbi:MAG TPA: alpha/beta hydrolase [Oculatellaceae cyanobacterium]